MKKTAKKTNRIIEITASVSAVIPTGNYENFKPMYSVKEIVNVGGKGNGSADRIISERTDELRVLLGLKLQEDYEKMRIERIKQQRQDIKFYPRGNKQYPSVTSVIQGVEPINFDPDKLKQYAARGNIVHKQIAHFFKTGKWEANILQVPDTKLDYLIVAQGSLKLKWEPCNFMGFWEKHGKDFTPLDSQKDDSGDYLPIDFESEVVVYNDENLFAGTLDLPANYKSIPSIVDFKTASNYDNDKLDKYWRQCAAYAVSLNRGIKQMVIVPLNPSNKTGFGTPMVEKDIDKYFNLFLQDRSAFKTIYGI